MELPASKAKVIGYVLGLGVFFAPLGWMFCSVWWGWKAPERRPGRPDALVTSGPLRICARRESSRSVRVSLLNSSGRKLRIVVPGSPGCAVRSVPADSLPNEAARLVYDDDRDAVVELLSDDSYLRIVRGDVPAGPFRAVYDTRGNGLPEGVWPGRAVSRTVP